MKPYGTVRALVLPILMAQVSLAASRLSGTVQDHRHLPIEGAQITIWDPAASQRFQTTSGAGRYSFGGVPPGDYLLKVEKPGMALLLGAFRLTRDSSREFPLVLVKSTGGAGTDVRAESRNDVHPAKGSALPKAPAGRVMPARVRMVMPAPTTKMKASGFGRSTQIAARIHADGTIDDMVVLFAPDSDFAMAALMAVREWKYSPTYLDGRAVEVVTTIDVKFHPRD